MRGATDPIKLDGWHGAAREAAEVLFTHVIEAWGGCRLSGIELFDEADAGVWACL